MTSSDLTLPISGQSSHSHLWPTLLTLLVGLMATSAATWINIQSQQRAAQQAFLQDATELGDAVRVRLQRTFIFLDTVSTLAATYRGDNSATLAKSIQESFPELTNVNVLLAASSPGQSIDVDGLPLDYAGPAWLLEDPAVQTLLQNVAVEGSDRLSGLHRRQPSGSGYLGELFWLTRHDNRVIAASIDVSSLLSGIEGNARFKGLQLEFFDLNQYSSDPFLRLPVLTETEMAYKGMVYNEENRWQAHETLALPGREWLLRLRPGPGLEVRFDSRIALMIFLTGCIISTLLAIIVHQRLQLLERNGQIYPGQS